MLNSQIHSRLQLAKPDTGEGKQDFLKRCMEGDEGKIVECTADWNKARLAAFVDDNRTTLKCDVALVELGEQVGDGDEPKVEDSNRFSMLAYTGKVIDWGWLGRFVLDLDGMYLGKDKVPALLMHSHYERVGVIDTSQNADSGFFVGGSFLLSSGEGQMVKAQAEEGFPWQASVGIQAKQVLEVGKGETYEVNGQKVEGPLTVWLKTEVYEVSFVPFGADDDTAAIAMQSAGVRDNPNQEESPMKKLLKALAAMGLRADATDEQVLQFLSMLSPENMATLSEHSVAITELKAKVADATPPTAPADPQPAANLQQPVQGAPPATAPAVSLSGAEVIQLQNEFGKVGVDADAVNKVLGDGNLSMADARKLLIDKAGAANPPVGAGRLDMGIDEADKIRLAMVHGMSLRLGMTVESLAPGHEQFRHMSLHELSRFCLHRSGVTGLEVMSKRRLAKEVLHLSAGVSTSDFTSVFMDVTNARLLQAYNEAPDTYSPWVNIVPASDFKEIYGVALSEAPTMDLVGENGEYKTVHLADNQESYHMQKRGFLIPLTMEMIVNDDLRAFNRIPQLIGSSARRTIADSVYGKLTGATVMSDGVALFHADHGNLETVSGNKGVVNSDKLSAARVGMRTQTGIGGSTLDLTPSFLLVPVAQETSADVLLQSAALPTADMSSGVKNPWAGKLQPIAEPRLDVASAKAWYTVADPNQIDTMEVAFLDGQSEPTVEEHAEYKNDSINFKGMIIYGVGCMDHRGFRKNPGE